MICTTKIQQDYIWMPGSTCGYFATENQKTCIVDTSVCVEDKELVFQSVEAYLSNFPWKTRNRLAMAIQLCDVLWLVISFGKGQKNYSFTTMDGEAQRFMFLPIL
jgi:hypothetical protein